MSDPSGYGFPRITPEMHAAQARQRQATELRNVKDATRDVREATLEVQKAVLQLADETARAQRLAIRVGVATAVLGAVLGGFSGAIAARLLGG